MMDEKLKQAQELDGEYLMQTYARKPVEFVSGKGMYLYDSEGSEYLDFVAGVASVSVGHSHPRVVEAMVSQAQKLVQVGNYYYVEHRGEVAAEISHLLEQNDADAWGNTGEHWRTFFANSGAEANEGAIKLARHYGNEHKDGAITIVCAKRSFHGRTLATLFATGQESKQEPFKPEVEGFVHVPLNDVAALEQELRNPSKGDVVAVMLECIQGESGVHPCDREYLREARRLTRELGMLLIIDEVQTGFYRTGKPFAFQQYDIVPDIVTIAKGMGGGVPIGGFCAPSSLALQLEPGEHGSTFGGNPLVCAASLAVLNVFKEENIADKVNENGAYLRSQLLGLPHVVEVRGLGLMLAAQLDADVAPEVARVGLENGLVLNYVGANILRFLPALICSTQDIDILIAKLTTILKDFG